MHGKNSSSINLFKVTGMRDFVSYFNFNCFVSGLL